MELYLWNCKENLAKKVKPNQGRGISFSLVSHQFYTCYFSSSVSTKSIPVIHSRHLLVWTWPLNPATIHGKGWAGKKINASFRAFLPSFGRGQEIPRTEFLQKRISFSLFTTNNFQRCTELGGYPCVHIFQPEMFLKGCFVSDSFSLPFPLYIWSHSSEEHVNASRDPIHYLDRDNRIFLGKKIIGLK